MTGLLTSREPDLRQFFNVRTLAEFLNVSQRTIYDLVERGDIGFYRVGRAIRFAARDVEAFLDAHRDGKA